MSRAWRTKRLGQVFLINDGVAKAEAAHAHGKIVIEMGPGRGILTRELCANAKKVIAVEKDSDLCAILESTMHFRNLKIINADFFDLGKEILKPSEADIFISNVPYVLSSRIIQWLHENRMEAVVCLQKEYVGRLLAKQGTRNYSRLSVMASLTFSITEIMDVPRRDFKPVPKVDSEVIFLKPRQDGPTPEEAQVIGVLMQHRRKKVRNAIHDSSYGLGIDRKEARKNASSIANANSSLFMLSPLEILDLAREIIKSGKRGSKRQR